MSRPFISHYSPHSPSAWYGAASSLPLLIFTFPGTLPILLRHGTIHLLCETSPIVEILSLLFLNSVIICFVFCAIQICSWGEKFVFCVNFQIFVFTFSTGLYRSWRKSCVFSCTLSLQTRHRTGTQPRCVSTGHSSSICAPFIMQGTTHVHPLYQGMLNCSKILQSLTCSSTDDQL